MLKIVTCSLATLTMVICTSADAQCNRGGGPPSSGSVATSGLPTGLNSQLASFNSFNSNPNLLAAQYQSQLSRYQTLLAQQQRNFQALAQRQQALERQMLARREDDRSNTQPATTNPRKQRLRQQNAEKALELAVRAEVRGRDSTAKSYYQRVLRIVGKSSELGSQADEGLARLRSNDVDQETLVATTN